MHERWVGTRRGSQTAKRPAAWTRLEDRAGLPLDCEWFAWDQRLVIMCYGRLW